MTSGIKNLDPAGEQSGDYGVGYVKIGYGEAGAFQLVDDDHPLPAGAGAAAGTPATNASFAADHKAVATAGTSVVLDAHACTSVTVKALHGNSGYIYVGGSDVASSKGVPLAAGESCSADVSNTNLVHLDASVSGEGVAFMWTGA